MRLKDKWVMDFVEQVLAFGGALIPGTIGLWLSIAGLIFSVFAAWRDPGAITQVNVVLSTAGIAPEYAPATAILTWAQTLCTTDVPRT